MKTKSVFNLLTLLIKPEVLNMDAHVHIFNDVF